MPGSEITVNRKPTKVLFLREVQTVCGEKDNQKVFETENQQNELKVPFLAVMLVPFRAPNSQWAWRTVHFQMRIRCWKVAVL